MDGRFIHTLHAGATESCVDQAVPTDEDGASAGHNTPPHTPALAMQPAGLLCRLLCLVYESFILLALALSSTALMTGIQSLVRHTLPSLVFFVVTCGVCFCYLVFCWMSQGQTVAMKAWRIRVVSDDYLLLCFPVALRRLVFAILGLLCGGVTLWWALGDRDKKFLHDRLSGCQLLRIGHRVDRL